MLLLLLIVFTEVVAEPCSFNTSIDISDGEVFKDRSVVKNGLRFPPQYVFKRNVTGETRTFGCVCKLRQCIHKCCEFDHVMYNKTCTKMPESDLIVNEGISLNYINSFRRKLNVTTANDFSFVYGRPCVQVYMETQKWYLQLDGSLYVDMPITIPPWMVRGPDTYCVDTFVAENEDGTWTKQMDALVCFAETQEEHFYLLTCTCMLISCVFILATVAVYAWLPELRNLHGKVLMAYLISLFVGFALFTTMQILLVIDNITTEMCTGMTIVIYFFLLTAFFWMNVMSFDIWWTFSGKRGLSLEKLSTQGRFYAYCMYAFGIPTALTILLVALEFSNLPPHPLLPLLRHRGCFIYGPSKLLYLYGPMVILIVANMIFFVLTAVKIAQIKKQTSVLKSKESSTHDQHRKDKQRLLLYVKLFAVMGINWILEVVSALYPEADIIWRVTDAYNVLIGVIIFIIFVCKRKIYQLMKKRYMQMRGKPVSSWRETTESTRTMSRSDDEKPGSIKLQTKVQKENITTK